MAIGVPKKIGKNVGNSFETSGRLDSRLGRKCKLLHTYLTELYIDGCCVVEDPDWLLGRDCNVSGLTLADL